MSQIGVPYTRCARGSAADRSAACFAVAEYIAYFTDCPSCRLAGDVQCIRHGCCEQHAATVRHGIDSYLDGSPLTLQRIHSVAS